MPIFKENLINQLKEVMNIGFILLSDIGKVMKARNKSLIVSGDKERLTVGDKNNNELAYITYKKDQLTVYKGKDFKIFKIDKSTTYTEVADNIVKYINNGK